MRKSTVEPECKNCEEKCQGSSCSNKSQVMNTMNNFENLITDKFDELLKTLKALAV